jgi:excisionase family DNA binding protein
MTPLVGVLATPTNTAEPVSRRARTYDLEALLKKPALSVEEAAFVLCVGRDSLYDAIKRGDFPSFRVGKVIRVPTQKLVDMLGLAA